MKTSAPKRALVFKGIDEISDFVIDRWLKIAADAINKNGCFTVALSGGKTPAVLYRKIVEVKDSFQWDRTHIFLVDERFVPYDDPESNFRMIKETLLDRIDIPAENIHPVPIAEDAASSAMLYERDLMSYFNLTGSSLPRFDLMLLGVGKDGHTASLFPGAAALNETERLAAAATRSDISKSERVTVTLPVINNSENIFFMATGADKAKTIREIVENKDCMLPAAMVKPENGTILFLVDEGAGSLLSNSKNRSREVTMAKVEDTPENAAICLEFCSPCPTFSDIEGEALFCARGRSSAPKEKHGCNCSMCTVQGKSGCRGTYYCINGRCE